MFPPGVVSFFAANQELLWLMTLVLENAGAQRGALLVDTAGQLMVQASGSLEAIDGAQIGALMDEVEQQFLATSASAPVSGGQR